MVVITEFDGYEDQIRSEVDDIMHLYISRKGVNPFVDSLTLLDLGRHLLNLKPEILLLFSIKPVIYGSMAAGILKIPAIAMITGLGTAFITETWITKVVKTLYRFALSSVSVVFFQNMDDRGIFVHSKLVSNDVCRLSPGSGVDLQRFSYSSPPDNTSGMRFLFIGRMLWDKGIREYVEAARTIKSTYPNVQFQLLGPLGVQNRTSVAEADVWAWENEGTIEYLGETDDVTAFIKNACCIVLPSYREGTSRVLLEAAAMGRPIVATDVPGCREVVEDGVSGFLCQPRDNSDLVLKIEKMLSLSHEARSLMGARGREKVENEFSQEIVCDLYVDALETILKA